MHSHLVHDPFLLVRRSNNCPLCARIEGPHDHRLRRVYNRLDVYYVYYSCVFGSLVVRRYEIRDRIYTAILGEPVGRTSVPNNPVLKGGRYTYRACSDVLDSSALACIRGFSYGALVLKSNGPDCTGTQRCHMEYK